MATYAVEFKCIKDFVMEDGEVSFSEGKYYTFNDSHKDDMVGLDNQYDWHWMSKQDDIGPHFIFSRVIGDK